MDTLNDEAQGGRNNGDTPESSKSSASQKRKAADGTPPRSTPARAKRNRYISIACNECKRRKIKCNGEVPCQRCGHLQLECVYAPNCCSNGFKDSEEYRQMSAHLMALQEQVDNLYRTLNTPQSQPNHGSRSSYQSGNSVGPLDPQIAFQHTPPTENHAKPPSRQRFSGPTSSAFDFHVANSSLQTMGITQPEYPAEESTSAHEGPNTRSPPPQMSPTSQQNVNPLKDPLWSLNQDEALRLCNLYEEEVGIMYPMLDMDQVMSKARTLFNFLDSMKRVGFLKEEIEQGDSLDDDETMTLKMILATALVVECNGRSELGHSLWENVRRISNTQDRLGRPATIKTLQILVVTAQYYFMIDEEVQSYRIIGLAARACFEMGLHRAEVLDKLASSEDERMWNIRLFWVIYSLDRRWSFGTGLPFSMQDADIDPQLPEPDEGVPYLKAMVHYGRISSKVWVSVASFDNASNEVRKEDISYLDYQILQWRNAIPDSLKFRSTDNVPDHPGMTRGIRRLRVLLYLRGNQLRMQLYRPILYSITSIMENRGHAQTVVEIAKDTIRVLTSLNQTSNIYQAQQTAFHYFLISALAVLFLSVSHAPAEFNSQVREEFYLALDLVRGCSSRSYVSRRLWKTIKGLKEVAPKLGLVSTQPLEASDPHSSAAVAMAGLAGHQVDEMSLYPQAHTLGSMGNSPMNGQQMSHELTNLFEAAGGYNGVTPGRPEGMMAPPMSQGPQNEMGPGMEAPYSMSNGNEVEFGRIMKECF